MIIIIKSETLLSQVPNFSNTSRWIWTLEVSDYQFQSTQNLANEQFEMTDPVSVFSSAEGIRWFQGTIDSRESLVPKFLRGNSCGFGISGSLESLITGNHWFPNFQLIMYNKPFLKVFQHKVSNIFMLKSKFNWQRRVYTI